MSAVPGPTIRLHRRLRRCGSGCRHSPGRPARRAPAADRSSPPPMGMATTATGLAGDFVPERRSRAASATCDQLGPLRHNGVSGSVEKTVWIWAPADTASSSRCGPSIRVLGPSLPIRRAVEPGRPARLRGCARANRAGSGVAVGHRHVDDALERLGIADSHLRQHLPVDLDLGGLEPGDQLGVRHPVLAGRGVDPDDPETSEVTLARPAVAVRILPGMHELFIGRPEAPAARPFVPLGPLENGARASSLRVRLASHGPWVVSFRLRCRACGGRAGGRRKGAPQCRSAGGTAAFPWPALGGPAPPGRGAAHRTGHFDPFGYSPVGLHLRHVRTSLGLLGVRRIVRPLGVRRIVRLSTIVGRLLAAARLDGSAPASSSWNVHPPAAPAPRWPSRPHRC